MAYPVAIIVETDGGLHFGRWISKKNNATS
uniref:Uncharacterized protein n=1 Tax=Klebsiella pneumoniae TaxID=573 RepID=A0A7D3TC99_KLEPN|nr:hypothetical protein EFNPAABL_00159 [Klebsiella pneumoniae]